MNSNEALAKLKALDFAGVKPAEAALAEENKEQAVVKVATAEAPRNKGRRVGRRSHSKGDAAAIVTGYLDTYHVKVLVDLRSRVGEVKALSLPSTNQLLRVALRLVKTLNPSDAQIVAAYVEEQSEK